MSETRRFAFVADFIRGLMPVTGRVFACQVAFAQVRHLSPCLGPVFQPLLVGWIRQPRRQSATVFGALSVFRHDLHLNPSRAKPLHCLSLSRPPFGKQWRWPLPAEHQSKHSAELCCPRPATARLDRTNADPMSTTRYFTSLSCILTFF